MLLESGIETDNFTIRAKRQNRNFQNNNDLGLHSPLLISDRRPPPWNKFLSLPNLPQPLKSKMAAMIFVKKILNTRAPKLRLLCGMLSEKRL